jgi:hypothetical protein
VFYALFMNVRNILIPILLYELNALGTFAILESQLIDVEMLLCQCYPRGTDIKHEAETGQLIQLFKEEMIGHRKYTFMQI